MCATAFENSHVAERRLWIRRLGGLAILVITGFAAYLVGSHQPLNPSSIENWPIAPVPSTLNFGEVWETDSFPWVVKFENVTDKTAVLEDCRSGCACVKIAPVKKQVLKPGEHTNIPVVVDLRQIRMNDQLEYRPVELLFVNRVAYRDEPSVQYRWYLRGQVRRAFSCDPQQFRLGEVLAASGPKSHYIAELRPYVPNIRIVVKNAPSELSTRLDETSNGYELRIAVKKMRPGRFNHKIDLEARNLDARLLSIQQVTLEGIVASAINVFPNDADFGVVRVGDIGTVTLSVCSTDDGPIEKVEVLRLEKPTRIRRVSQADGIWRFQFERTISAVGPGAAKATFRVRNGTSEIALPFQLRWYGLEKRKE